MHLARSALRLILAFSTLMVVSVDSAYADGCKGILSESIKGALIFPPGVNFKIEDTGELLTLSTYRHPQATDSDMKIDTLLVCKEVLNQKQNLWRKVVVLFFSYDNQNLFTRVTANLGDVKKWERRELGRADLLRTIALEHSKVPNPFSRFSQSSYDEIASIAEPMQGILYEQRKQLAQQISQAKTLGVDVASVVTAYLLMEDSVRLDDEAGVCSAYAYTLSLYDNIVGKNGKVTSRRMSARPSGGRL
jgi:hypothetical protein